MFYVVCADGVIVVLPELVGIAPESSCTAFPVQQCLEAVLQQYLPVHKNGSAFRAHAESRLLQQSE